MDSGILIIIVVICSCIITSTVVGIIISKQSKQPGQSGLFSKLSQLIKSSVNQNASDTKSLDIKANSTESGSIKIVTKINKNKTNTDIICNVLDKPNQSITCIDPESSTDTYITITEGEIIKISFSEEKEKGSNPKTNLDYYLILPYVFTVNYAVSLGTGEIVINTLDDLLNSFKKVERDYNSGNTIPGKCLKVKSETRAESKPPYNETCLFFDMGFSKIRAITDLITDVYIPFIPVQVLNDYYSLLSSKIKNTNSLSIFEYVMYLTLLNKVKQKNYNYVSQCQSIVNSTTGKSLDYINC